jgi:DNA-binding transcriptional regulator GbsR (MarR family)
MDKETFNNLPKGTTREQVIELISSKPFSADELVAIMPRSKIAITMCLSKLFKDGLVDRKWNKHTVYYSMKG